MKQRWEPSCKAVSCCRSRTMLWNSRSWSIIESICESRSLSVTQQSIAQQLCIALKTKSAKFVIRFLHWNSDFLVYEDLRWIWSRAVFGLYDCSVSYFVPLARIAFVNLHFLVYECLILSSVLIFSSHMTWAVSWSLYFILGLWFQWHLLVCLLRNSLFGKYGRSEISFCLDQNQINIFLLLKNVSWLIMHDFSVSPLLSFSVAFAVSLLLFYFSDFLFHLLNRKWL